MAEIHILLHHNLGEGDAVRLKSGGPVMLVTTADGQRQSAVECVWTNQRLLKTDWFEACTLDVVARA